MIKKIIAVGRHIHNCEQGAIVRRNPINKGKRSQVSGMDACDPHTQQQTAKVKHPMPLVAF